MAVITDISRDYVRFQVVERLVPLAESPIRITIGQAIIKIKKMDWVIQKATELGISAVIPFTCSRSIPILKGDKVAKRVERWRSIALESLKQCGRNIPPRIENITTFDEIVEMPGELSLNLILWENAPKNGLYDILRSNKTRKIFALIGPEGGFTRDEAEKAKMYKFIPIRMGDRLLRAETAAIAFMSIAQYELGDLG